MGGHRPDYGQPGIAGLAPNHGAAMNGAESLVHTLIDNGVDVCFANPGSSEIFASINTIWKNPPGSGSVVLAGASDPGSADGSPQLARFKFAGTGVPVPHFQLPMVVDSVGNLYLCDDNNLRRVAKDGFVTTLTGRPGMLAGVGVGGLEDQPFNCSALALRGDKTLYVGRGTALFKLQLP